MEDALRVSGCRAAGYRLLGRDGSWSAYCCKHLDRNWRAITTFDSRTVIVVAVGEHDGPAFYRRLSEELGISQIGQRRDEKPECCGPDGWPSVGLTRPERRARS